MLVAGWMLLLPPERSTQAHMLLFYSILIEEDMAVDKVARFCGLAAEGLSGGPGLPSGLQLATPLQSLAIYLVRVDNMQLSSFIHLQLTDRAIVDWLTNILHGSRYHQILPIIGADNTTERPRSAALRTLYFFWAQREGGFLYDHLCIKTTNGPTGRSINELVVGKGVLEPQLVTLFDSPTADSPPHHTPPPHSQDSDKTQAFPPQTEVTPSSTQANEG